MKPLTNPGDYQEESPIVKRKKINFDPQPQLKKIEVVKEERNWLDLLVDVLLEIFRKLGAFDIVSSAQFVCSVHSVRLDPESQLQKIEVVKEERNWLDLPVDVQYKIFEKLGAFDILSSAQYVCSVWRNLSKQPCFFRFIKLHPPWYFRSSNINIINIEKQIIDRSCGLLVGLSMVIHNNTEEVLRYAVNKPNSLKFLKLTGVSAEGLMIAITKVPFLEKLELSLKSSSDYSSQKQLIAEIGRSCVQLKYLSLCHIGDNDEEVTAVAEYMPQLRELHLDGLLVSNRGLQALLRGCPYLECLNLEKCYYSTNLTEESLSECQRLKTSRLPVRRFYGRYAARYLNN